MQISELITALTQIKDQHGDVQVFGCDYYGEDCDPEPRLRKAFMVGDEQHAVREDEFEQCAKFLADTTLEKQIAAATEDWRRINDNAPRTMWTKETMVENVVRNFEHKRKIVDAWPTATPQVTL